MDMLLLIPIILTLVILFFLLSMVWPPDSPWSPWWRTTRRIARIQCRLAHVTSKDTVYDLGSGDGTALITAATEFGAKGVGVEIDPFRYFYSKLAIVFHGASKQLKVERKNFFDVNTSEATVVFMYLIPEALNKLKPKLLKELKPGTRVVTFVYKIDLPMIAKDVDNEVYVFEIPKKK
jgi:predicted RNA methylase